MYWALSFLTPRNVLAGLVVLALVSIGWMVYQDTLAKGDAMGAARVQALWDAASLSQYQALATATDKLEAEKQALQRLMDEQRRTSDDKIASVNSELALALSRLRNRPSRPTSPPGNTDVPSPAPVESSCTGTGLSREDAEFLVRESARANKLRINLAECHVAYDAAQKRSVK